MLLDTQVFLWWQNDDARLTTAVRNAMDNRYDNEIHVSAASIWEIAIKVASGRLRIPSAASAAVVANGFSPLDITFAHAERAGALPPHHGDPFDRMIVAQDQMEGLVLVSDDAKLVHGA